MIAVLAPLRRKLLDQAIPYPNFAEQMLWRFWVQFELGPELTDDHTQILHVVLMGGPPYLRKGLTVGHDLIGVGCQQGKQIEFLGRQVNMLVVDGHHAMLEVEQNIAEPALRRLLVDAL